MRYLVDADAFERFMNTHHSKGDAIEAVLRERAKSGDDLCEVVVVEISEPLRCGAEVPQPIIWIGSPPTTATPVTPPPAKKARDASEDAVIDAMVM